MRRRPALSPRVLLLLLVAAGGWGAAPVAADGNVGCLFSESLCTEKVEWCYDDYAFGKCLQVYGNVEEEDLVRHELTTEELRELERELQRLLQLGYRWSHAYTQCVLQAMLYSIHNRVHYESTMCDHLADQDLTAALGAFEADEEVDPQSVAFVRYTPNNAIQDSDFADEVYYPPSELELLENLPVQSESETPPEEIPENSDDFDWSQYHKRAFERDERMSRRSRRNQQESQTFSRIYNTPKNFREGYETKDFSLDNIEQIIANNEKYQSIPYQDIVTENDKNNIGLTPEDILYLMQPENQEELHAALPQFIDAADNSFGAPDVSYSQILPKDPMNKWLENQDLDQLRAALAELKEPFKQNPDPYYVSTSEFLTKNRLRPDRFNQHYNTPDRFRQGYESRDGVLNSKYEEGDMPEPRIYIDEDEQDHYREESGSGEHDGRPDTLNQLELLAHNVVPQNEYPAYEEMYRGEQDSNVEMDEEQQAALLSRLVNTWRSNMYNQRPDQHERPHAGGQAFTEGGLVYVADPSDPTTGEDKAQLLSPELGALLADYEEGFRRRERLDVKKPGPPFDVKNHHFKHNTAENQTNAPDTEGVVAPLMVKKELHDKQEQIIQDDHHVSYVVDNSYAYVGVKDTIRTWEEGESVIRAICNLLHLEPSAVTHHRVDRNEVTFRVGENKQGLNASEVASRIDGIKGELKNALGIEVTSAGLGDKAKYPAVLKLEANSGGWEELWTSNWGVGVAVASGGVAALMAATALFLLVRQRRHKHDKLRNLAGGDTEASQDYQDLCRARMSGKWSPPSGGGAGEQKAAGDKPETTGQRITSLSRESDGNSPSTRSSTSSWSEEPALTNMDISTGHMVLTYMEDHLKNKDRLEQEWQALCAYEAEPSAALAAQTTENAPKNRTPGVLPYDHARLVLNDVTNHNSSDYINASTITDHDPRNPAYIAAQGPLAQTAPDFWQMVWEQGSVVMVMLTRLTEAGQPMCHRYWPEEGSDLYHIYEVHLVSEHIWCDDYLVRSFYLKNLKTGETRTVTQFHFLSWPDRGVPSSTKALLEFRRKVNKSYRGRSCPIVVHCSDGAGRTGTYCLIDMVLNRMAKGAKEIDIAATLEHIRDQRPHMVTTKQQFEFVLMAVAEEVHAILKALPAQLQQQHEKREKELAAEKEKQDKEKLVKEK